MLAIAASALIAVAVGWFAGVPAGLGVFAILTLVLLAGRAAPPAAALLLARARRSAGAAARLRRLGSPARAAASLAARVRAARSRARGHARALARGRARAARRRRDPRRRPHRVVQRHGGACIWRSIPRATPACPSRTSCAFPSSSSTSRAGDYGKPIQVDGAAFGRPRAVDAGRDLRREPAPRALARRDPVPPAGAHAPRVRGQRVARAAHAAHRRRGIPRDAARRARSAGREALHRPHDASSRSACSAWSKTCSRSRRSSRRRRRRWKSPSRCASSSSAWAPRRARFPTGATRSRSKARRASTCWAARRSCPAHSATSSRNAIRYTPPSGHGAPSLASHGRGRHLRRRRHAASASRPSTSRDSRSASIASTAVARAKAVARGLGLAIVKHALSRHGAALDIASSPGEGSRFSARFAGPRVRGKSRASA